MIITSLSLTVCLKGTSLLSSTTFCTTGRKHLLSQITSLINIAKFRAIVRIPDLVLKLAASSFWTNEQLLYLFFFFPNHFSWYDARSYFFLSALPCFRESVICTGVFNVWERHIQCHGARSAAQRKNQALCLDVYLLQPEDKYSDPERKKEWVFYHWRRTEKLCR